MPSSDIPSLVEKYPSCNAAERDQLLNFARTTPLHYGAWKHFKQLFKKVEAALGNKPDIELLGVLLWRIDTADFAQQNTRWKAVDATIRGSKHKSVSGGGFKYTVGPRNEWYDYSGWRLVVEPESSSVLSGLKRALKLGASDAKTVAFDFDARTTVYDVKKVSLENGALNILCGGTWRGSPEQSFVVDVSDPNFIHLREDGPRIPTLQYMKRRARRILRHLNQTNSQLYLQLATRLLREHGNNTLNPALNWAAMDVLFADSARWEQTQPGRGAYKKLAGKFVRTRREERAPQIWDAHLEQARALLTSNAVPTEANEMALKVLRAHGENITPGVLQRPQLLRFLESDAPLLQHLATRLLAQSSEQLDGATWARLALLADANTRRMLNALPIPVGNHNRQASQVLSETLEKTSATRKRRAALLLVEHFAEQISDEIFWRRLDTFADVGPSIHAWLIVRMRQSGQNGEFARLSNLAFVRPELHQILLNAFSEGARDAAVSVEIAFPLVAGNNQISNINGWHFLATTTIAQDVIRQLWQRVWSTSSGFAWQVHETAAQNESALQLFERADFSAEKLQEWLPQVPAFVTALMPDFFAAVFRRVSPLLQIDLALSATDEQWQTARTGLLQTLQNAELLDAFWARVLQRVETAENPALLGRIIDDTDISATFTRVPSSTIAPLLERTDPALESWLALWLDANAAYMSRGDASLLAAATHPLAAIRQRGLARIQQTGLDLPLALRLMESGLPQPFAIAREWFETHETMDVADRALALCDSPDAEVRAYGRSFLEAQGERVLDAKILKKLSENADPQMQAWLAEHLLKDAHDVDVAAFDASVLKTRGRARRAKEAVKARRDLTQTGAPEYSGADTATLLEVARGRTKRDKEWALQQLAQAALAGQEIDGVQVKSVGGQ